MLWSGGSNDPVFVTYAEGDPGPFGLWDVEAAGLKTLTISHVGLGKPVSLNYKREIDFGDPKEPFSFTLVMVGENVFSYSLLPTFFLLESFKIQIRVVNEDKFWTIESRPMVSTVSLELPSGEEVQLW
ncbi:hypothetical protein MVEN_01885700 [Mycena venus]|uniref:Uncharacterized protein n=1 Tax=Mycena venus TaxID=2733690 RepID=A0A8H6XHU6_9AGAR|nr:hypothetical protein MVEN_01885700 [Mycena venus]